MPTYIMRTTANRGKQTNTNTPYTSSWVEFYIFLYYAYSSYSTLARITAIWHTDDSESRIQLCDTLTHCDTWTQHIWKRTNQDFQNIVSAFPVCRLPLLCMLLHQPLAEFAEFADCWPSRRIYKYPATIIQLHRHWHSDDSFKSHTWIIILRVLCDLTLVN